VTVAAQAVRDTPKIAVESPWALIWALGTGQKGAHCAPSCRLRRTERE